MKLTSVTDWKPIIAQISMASGEFFDPEPPQNLAGGSISKAVKLEAGNRTWFVKLNSSNMLSMFQGEYAGLMAMADTRTVRVPMPLCVGTTKDESYIVMEHFQLGPHQSSGQPVAGRLLAKMHRTSNLHYGWHRNNTIGSTPQINDWSQGWVYFWRKYRLGYQLNLAKENGFGGKIQTLGERLMSSFPALIDHAPKPSLLHGDLWGGNMGFDQQGQPIFYDPATYFGDREADLAMTELFGGFSRDFYAAYEEEWPLASGYKTRKVLYNLYHILNHLNLFGAGYAARAQDMMEQLLAELGE